MSLSKVFLTAALGIAASHTLIATGIAKLNDSATPWVAGFSSTGGAYVGFIIGSAVDAYFSDFLRDKFNYEPRGLASFFPPGLTIGYTAGAAIGYCLGR